MTRRKKQQRGNLHPVGPVVRSEYVVAQTDEIIHRAELNSAQSQAAAMQRAAEAEAKATAAVAATDC